MDEHRSGPLVEVAVLVVGFKIASDDRELVHGLLVAFKVTGGNALMGERRRSALAVTDLIVQSRCGRFLLDD